MKLPYDPGQDAAFWEAIKQIPGYPHDDPDMPIRTMIFESDALFRVPDVLALVGADPAQPLLVVMDSTPMKRGEDDLKHLVSRVLNRAGWQVEELVLEPDHTGQVHTDMEQINTVKHHLREGMAALALGSGTITDIVKHGCYNFENETDHQIPLVVFQTANSVSAYTSNMAPVFVNGVKRTLNSRYPDALVCDLETLRDAPREMTVAGVGDLLAFFVSFPDWYLASQLGMDSTFTEFSQELMGPLGDILMDSAGGIRSGALDGMAILAKLIALSGLAMSLSHATTPFSGYEHVMSHVLDMQAEKTNRPLAQHGTQVALAALLGAEAYRHLLTEFEPAEVKVEQCYPEPEQMRAHIMAQFGVIDPSDKAGEECWNDYQIKLEAWQMQREQFEAFLGNWEAVKAGVERYTRSPEEIAAVLRAVDSPMTFAGLVPPANETQVHFAFLNAPLMRKRFSVGDLLIYLQWDREALWQQVWTISQQMGGTG